MFCPKCGSKLDETTKTCTNCGFTLTPKEGVENQQEPESLETNPAPATTPVEQIQTPEPTTPAPTPEQTATTPSPATAQTPAEEAVDNLAIDKETQALLDEVPEEAKNEPENPPVIEVDKGPSPLPSENHIANQVPPQNNSNAVKIVVIGTIVFIILFLLAIYLIFYSEDGTKDKVESNVNEEETVNKSDNESNEPTEKVTENGDIEATIKTDNGNVTFIVPKICTGDEMGNNDSDTYKLYMGTDSKCSTLGFMYIPYNSAQEAQEESYNNPYQQDIERRKFTVKLNNGVEVYGVETYEGIGSLYYPVDEESCIEISLSLPALTDTEINKYVIVKE